MYEVDRSQPQAFFGLKLGLMVASVFAVGFVLARRVSEGESALPEGVDPTEQILLFYAAGIIGGLAFGFLFPLTRHRWGAAVAGMASLAPYYVGQWWLRGGPSDLAEIVGLVVTIPLVGGAVGYWAGSRYPDQNHRPDA